MKRAFCILLSFWLLLAGVMPGNDVEELSKIPTLIRHYLHHRALSNEDLGFSHFLQEHYNGKVPCGPEHEKLPFVKHVLPCLVYILPDFGVKFSPAIHYLPPPAFQEPKFCFVQYCSKIWQPPQLA